MKRIPAEDDRQIHMMLDVHAPRVILVSVLAAMVGAFLGAGIFESYWVGGLAALLFLVSTFCLQNALLYRKYAEERGIEVQFSLF